MVFDPYPVVGVDPVERFAVVGLCPEKMVFMAYISFNYNVFVEAVLSVPFTDCAKSGRFARTNRISNMSFVRFGFSKHSVSWHFFVPFVS